MLSEDFVDSTIANLKIIGMVPRNGRLCVRKGQLCLETSDQLQAVRRWARGDSLFAELGQCEIGLQNLRTTYASDSMMVANVGVLQERIASYRAEAGASYRAEAGASYRAEAGAKHSAEEARPEKAAREAPRK
jgi:hypothetical protein